MHSGPKPDWNHHENQETNKTSEAHLALRKGGRICVPTWKVNQGHKDLVFQIAFLRFESLYCCQYI